MSYSLDPFSKFLKESAHARDTGATRPRVSGVAFDVLQRLARGDRMAQIRQELGLTELQLARAVVELQEFDLIVLTGEDEESAQLTEEARRALGLG